jgi:hypothetical protein
MFAIMLGMAFAGAYEDGFDAGVNAAKEDTPAGQPLALGAASGVCGGACCIAGVYGGAAGCLIAGAAPTVLAVVSSDPEELPEGDAQYVEGYQDGYSKTRRQQRVKYATIGAAGGGVVTGTVVYVALVVLLVGAGVV